MKNKKPLLRWTGLLAIIALAFVSFGLSASNVAQAKKSIAPQRADIVIIDSMAELGKLELPPVSFKHDKHTEALIAQGKDCATCHTPVEDSNVSANWSYKFKRTEDTTYAAVKEIYHAGCISCHATEAKEGRASGPQAAECRSCHYTTPNAQEGRMDVGMDKYLHNTHVQSTSIKPTVANTTDNCSACHYMYKPAGSNEPRAWVPQTEDSCRSCHMAAPSQHPDYPDQTLISLQAAAHDSCISCHFNLALEKGADNSGPYSCAGCHGSVAQMELQEKNKKEMLEVPRLNRGQPNSTLLLPLPGEKIKITDVAGTMRPVAFDHKTHEMALDTCRSCHHKEIASCSSCHTLEGSAKGDFINLYEAMHKVDAERSCIGCHTTYTAEPSCAGCHNPMPVTRSTQSCASCHITPAGVTNQQAQDGSLLKMNKELLTRMATSTVDARNAGKPAISIEDIPETVTIGILAKEYKPTILPHRKIVQSLEKGMSDSKLAQAFHGDITTMCQGCHHNSPASLTPPKCASCHTTGDTPSADGRPTLKVAYHTQCMSCHTAMNLEKPANTDCASCHELAK